MNHREWCAKATLPAEHKLSVPSPLRTLNIPFWPDHQPPNIGKEKMNKHLLLPVHHSARPVHSRQRTRRHTRTKVSRPPANLFTPRQHHGDSEHKAYQIYPGRHEYRKGESAGEAQNVTPVISMLTFATRLLSRATPHAGVRKQ